MNLVSSAGSRFSNSALVQPIRTSDGPPSTRSSGTSRLGPCRKPGSTTRWGSALATGLTPPRLTLPTGPSVQLASAPIVYSAASAIAVLFLSSPPIRAMVPLVTLRSADPPRPTGHPLTDRPTTRTCQLRQRPQTPPVGYA